jgi:predicted nucleic acid-binding protein
VITYLDTSSLVKLYLTEKGSLEVRGLVNRSEIIATSRVAYIEARAAFARLRRAKVISEEEQDRIVKALDRDWEEVAKIEVTEEIIKLGSELAEVHGLRGFDALHLASALSLGQSLGEKIIFSSFDKLLNQAARREGLLEYT